MQIQWWGHHEGGVSAGAQESPLWNFHTTFGLFYSDVDYRLQQSCCKVILSQACVKNSVHGGGVVSASVHAGIHPPPGQTHPPVQTHPHG